MLLCDVNALVYAHRADAVQHTAYRAWLDKVRIGAEPLGLPEQVLAGFVRVVTHPRIFRDPTSPTIALSFVNRLRVSPDSVFVRPGERAWPVFDELVTRTGAKGNAIPYAYLAAMTVEAGAVSGVF